MGPCLSKKARNIEIADDFLKDITHEDRTITPLFSTLYNALRKMKNIEIINETGRDLFKNQSQPDIPNLKLSYLKMLYNFKTVVWVGPRSVNLDTIQKSTSIKQLFVISIKTAQKFLEEFPIFSHRDSETYKAKDIPLLAFYSQQLGKVKSRTPTRKIFIHAKGFGVNDIYNKLSINEIIQQSKGKVIKTSKLNVLYEHSVKTEEKQLVEILTDIVMRLYTTQNLSTKLYLQRSLPSTQSLDIAKQSQIFVPTSSKVKGSKEELKLEEQFENLFHKLRKQIGGDNVDQKVDRAYRLLVTLLSNICNNQKQMSYRRVKKRNKAVDEAIGKYKTGVQLLKLNGFEADKEDYANVMETRYLKVYRTALDLGYRKYVESK